MEHYYKKPIDPRRFKGPLLSNLRAQAAFFKQTADILLSKYQPIPTKCFVCGSDDHSNIEFTAFGISYVKCPTCNLVYVNKIFPKEAMAEFYKSDLGYQVCYTNEQYDYRVEKVSGPKVEFTDQFVKNQIDKTWLDVGSGIGDALVIAKRLGYRAVGLEIGKESREFGIKKFGVDLRNEEIETFKTNEKFSVISFFGYLDIVNNPVEQIECAKKLLKRGGIININVPNFNSFSSRLQKVFPDQCTRYFFPVNELMMFTEETLEYLLRKTGFKPLAYWWFGLDIMELANNLNMAIEKFPGSKAEEYLFENFNLLQEAINKNKNSDSVMVVAQKIELDEQK